MSTLEPFSKDLWLGILVALLCGTVIGTERQLRAKPTGIRTCILICLGTELFVELGRLFAGGGDPTRVLGQVVTGVGFLGGGLILAREGVVTGVTTASVVWVLAAIGCAVGLGQHAAAIVFALVTVVILAGIEALEERIPRLGRHLKSSREG